MAAIFSGVRADLAGALLSRGRVRAGVAGALLPRVRNSSYVGNIATSRH
jgi:hypothetical protein